ncbi:MAG TPA: hypothetical protein VGM88_10965 [Kofleriaceae bacterium]|jgi:hypothetical protein
MAFDLVYGIYGDAIQSLVAELYDKLHTQPGNPFVVHGTTVIAGETVGYTFTTTSAPVLDLSVAAADHVSLDVRITGELVVRLDEPITVTPTLIAHGRVLSVGTAVTILISRLTYVSIDPPTDLLLAIVCAVALPRLTDLFAKFVFPAPALGGVSVGWIVPWICANRVMAFCNLSVTQPTPVDLGSWPPNQVFVGFSPSGVNTLATSGLGSHHFKKGNPAASYDVTATALSAAPEGGRVRAHCSVGGTAHGSALFVSCSYDILVPDDVDVTCDLSFSSAQVTIKTKSVASFQPILTSSSETCMAIGEITELILALFKRELADQFEDITVAKIDVPTFTIHFGSQVFTLTPTDLQSEGWLENLAVFGGMTVS